MGKRPLQLQSDEEITAEKDAHFAARAAHLQWCKDRALAELNAGEVTAAFTSFLSDAGNKAWRSPDGTDHPPVINFMMPATMMLFQLGQMHALNHDAEQMRYWIEGFN